MKLIVIDPRNVGLANKADVWLRVRPGTDGALALGLANMMIQRGWYDGAFVRTWSNGPLLVRSDTRQVAQSGRPAFGRAARDICRLGSRIRPRRQLRPGGRPLRGGRRDTCACGANTGRDRRRSDLLPACLRALRSALQQLSARKDRSDVLDSARPAGGSGPHDLARAAGLLLRLERARASCQHHRDGARDGPALCPDRQFRCGRRQRAAPRRAYRVDRGEGLAGGETACARDRGGERPLGLARWKHISPRDFYRAVLEDVTRSRSRTHRVRLKSAARSRRSGSRTRCAGRAGFLCTRRSFHEPDGGACGYCAARGVMLRT